MPNPEFFIQDLERNLKESIVLLRRRRNPDITDEQKRFLTRKLLDLKKNINEELVMLDNLDRPLSESEKLLVEKCKNIRTQIEPLE